MSPIREWLDQGMAEFVDLRTMIVRKVEAIDHDKWCIEARRPRRGTWFEFRVAEREGVYDVVRECANSGMEPDPTEFKGLTDIDDFMHVLRYYEPDIASCLWLRMQEEVKTWSIPMVNRQLCEDYLLRRVYSMSEIKVLHVDQAGALVAYNVFFRDLGMDFDLRFEARMRWCEDHATVEVMEASWGRPLVFTTKIANDLKQCVFGPFHSEHERLLADVMSPTAKRARKV